MKKAFKYIIYTIAATLTSLYLLGFVLLRTPAIQKYVANNIENTLKEKIGSEVKIGKVDLRLFNRVIIDDILIYDQHHKQMLKAGRVSVAIDILPLLDGKISISSAQLFGTKVNLYQTDASTPLNCQFVIDSLSTKSEEKTPLDLHIASLIIRNGALIYDRLDMPQNEGSFSPHHLNISKISSHIIIDHITDNEIRASVKKLSLLEASGLNIKNLTATIKYLTNSNGNNIDISEFNLIMPNSNIEINQLIANFITTNGGIDSKSLKLRSKIHASSISPKDFAPLLSSNLANTIPTLTLDANTELNEGNLTSTINMRDTKSSDLALDASVVANQLFSHCQSNLKIRRMHASENILASLTKEFSLPEQLTRLGNIDLKGEANYDKDNSYHINTDIETSKAGAANITASYNILNARLTNIKADVNTRGLNLSQILNNPSLGVLKCDLNVDGNILDNKQITSLNAKGHIDEITYNYQQYTNIDIDGNYANNEFIGSIGINDPVISFVADINAATRNKSIDDIDGNVEIRDLYLAKQDARLNNISLTATSTDDGHRKVVLSTDFAELNMEGDIQLSTLPQSITNLIVTHLPSVPGLPSFQQTHNNYSINATIDNILFIKQLTGINIDIDKPLTINGLINDNELFANVNLSLPSLNIGDTRLNDTRLTLWTPDNSLNATLTTLLQEQGGVIKLNLDCEANNNNLISKLTWDNMRPNIFKGTLNTHTHFHRTLTGGDAFDISIPHSDFEIGDTLFNITSHSIAYSDNRLTIEQLNIGNASQHLYVNGTVSKSEQDSIVTDLKNIDVSYILQLVNFTSVEFDGKASGRAVAYSVLKDMNASAHLDVEDFLFQKGRMGILHADATYSNDSQQIDIDAVADDADAKAQTLIHGYISPQRNSIDLDIKAENTRLEFMQDFCGSFLSDVDLHGDGEVKLHGPFSALELTGELVANGDVTVSSTNCRYTLQSDTIRLVPDDIIFNNAPIIDKYGNKATITGGIHHKHLGRMSYDLTARTEKLLAYDFPTMPDNSTFCGSAIIRGTVIIKGKGNELNINAYATVLKDSYIIYNASSPDAITSQEFITWGSINNPQTTDTLLIADTKHDDDEEDNIINSGNRRTNIRMNFIVNVTPEARLHLLMDAITGDYIDLYGSGDLRISFYNKGAFEIFGNYEIDHGTYKMTIQNILRRDFAFQRGSIIAFGGDPFDATLRMTAAYQLNSVSLSDLNIGSSFKANNVPVNCIMNITGTAGKPAVNFSLDLPSLSSDARQMVYSIINSEESMNQQVLYLLAIGRFYATNANTSPDSEQTGQTTLAMQSFLSGTFSQQLNQVLNQLIGSNQWSFGANIATGTDGLSNAEYEGTLSGRMFNNRLIFNGQFGYRDNIMTNSQSFIGDFDIQYLLTPNGNISLKVYNQANDRYFTRNSLNTQGIGIVFKREFGK